MNKKMALGTVMSATAISNPTARHHATRIAGPGSSAALDHAAVLGSLSPGAAGACGKRRPGLALLLATLLAVALQMALVPVAEAGPRVAVLDIELLKADYLPNADRILPEERRRLDMVAELVRDRLRAEGYDTVPAAQTRAAIHAADPGQYLHSCNGCERRIARDLGADWVAVGWIQFVSYLILNLNVMVIDVESGAPVAGAFVDLRGNTDRSWRRATVYMLDNILVDRLARRRQAPRAPTRLRSSVRETNRPAADPPLPTRRCRRDTR